MHHALEKSDEINCQDVEEESNSQGLYILQKNYSDYFPFLDPLDNSIENQPENLIVDPFEEKPDYNAPLNEKNNSSAHKTDNQLCQKKTSDKSNNNSNHLSNEKDIKLDLNESNEKDKYFSINEKPKESINHKTQKGPFNIIKKIKLGRKTRNSCQKGKHNKYSYDNMTRKLKQILINLILNFVNNSIIKEEEIDMSIQKRKKRNKWEVNSIHILKKINQDIIKNINREYNLKLLYSKLKEILSENITGKIKKNLKKDYNKKLIDDIYKNNKKEKTINILNMTLLQCINHLTKKEFYPELQGLENEYENIINILKNSGETDEYIKLFKDLLGRFEEFYRNKKIYNCKKNGETKRQK